MFFSIPVTAPNFPPQIPQYFPISWAVGGNPEVLSRVLIRGQNAMPIRNFRGWDFLTQKKIEQFLHGKAGSVGIVRQERALNSACVYSHAT